MRDELTMLSHITIGFTAVSRLWSIAFCLMLLFQCHPAVAADRPGDEFLAGYTAAVLEQDLYWEKGSYGLKVVNGVATVTLFKDDPARQAAADQRLRTIDGLNGIAIVVKAEDDRKPGVVSKFLGVTGAKQAFPTGDLFQSLIANPKQPRFFTSLIRFDSLGSQYTMASVGFGETFGLYRFSGSREGDGLQLGLEAALFAQFNMDTPSYNLINADYTIGIPVTYRHGEDSLRLRIYHQSSHLGDELLQSANPPERVNLSYEAIELIYSREWRRCRVYGGGEYLIHKEPDALKPLGAHWGMEYRGSKPLLWGGRPIGGLDMKSFDEHDWDIDTSVKAGLEFGHPNPGQRRLSVMAEWYKGFDPRGQFYINKVEYYGMEVSLGF